MNLIEQLGGYEKAKNIRLSNEEDWMFYSTKKDWYSDIKHDESFLFIDDLKYQLLQYRRAHNIYESGDSVLHPMFNTVFKIDNVFGDHVIGATKSGYRTKLAINLIEHAEPSEIAAGRRL